MSQFGGTLPRRTDNGHNGMDVSRSGFMVNGSCNDINDIVPTIKPRVLSPCKLNGSQHPKTLPKDMEDLIHLPGPLTEDAVMRTLQARFADGKHFVSKLIAYLNIQLTFAKRMVHEHSLVPVHLAHALRS